MHKKWEHIILTRSGSTLKFYIDGELVGTEINSNTLDFNSCPLYIGARVNTGCASGFQDYFDGKIDEVKIYNYALTEEQVKNDYNGGAVRFGE